MKRNLISIGNVREVQVINKVILPEEKILNLDFEFIEIQKFNHEVVESTRKIQNENLQKAQEKLKYQPPIYGAVQVRADKVICPSTQEKFKKLVKKHRNGVDYINNEVNIPYKKNLSGERPITLTKIQRTCPLGRMRRIYQKDSAKPYGISFQNGVVYFFATVAVRKDSWILLKSLYYLPF